MLLHRCMGRLVCIDALSCNGPAIGNRLISVLFYAFSMHPYIQILHWRQLQIADVTNCSKMEVLVSWILNLDFEFNLNTFSGTFSVFSEAFPLILSTWFSAFGVFFDFFREPEDSFWIFVVGSSWFSRKSGTKRFSSNFKVPRSLSTHLRE